MVCACRLGRRILRPLLRSEVGEVANRRAWFDMSKLTPEVLQLYKQPLKVQGWDLALLEVSTLPAPCCQVPEAVTYLAVCMHDVFCQCSCSCQAALLL